MNNQHETPSFRKVLYNLFVKNMHLRALALLVAVALTILLYSI